MDGAGASYMSAKEGGGHSFEWFLIKPQNECPCHVYTNSIPLKQIITQTVTYSGATSGFSQVLMAHNTGAM